MTDSITATLDSPANGCAPPVPGSSDTDPFDRMLLTADGTVTTLLEACTGEPIVTGTTRLAGPAPLDHLLGAVGRWWHPDPRLLDLAPLERVIVRRVTLRGERSDLAYVAAESLVVPDRLPDAIAGRLVQPGASLGRVLAAHRLETRRELAEIVAARAGAVGDHLGVRPGALLARRTYTIVVGRRAVAAVTEWLVPGRLAARTPWTAGTRRRHPDGEPEPVWILQRHA
jgi:chorismate-pyruvate lyase